VEFEGGYTINEGFLDSLEFIFLVRKQLLDHLASLRKRTGA